jgi:hypothetical protein
MGKAEKTAPERLPPDRLEDKPDAHNINFIPSERHLTVAGPAH